MTPDWEKIKTQYIEGSESYTALARRWGVGQRSLAIRGRDEGWPQLRALYRTAQRGSAEVPAGDEPPLSRQHGGAVSMVRIESVMDLLLDQAERLLYEDQDAQTLQRIATTAKTVKETMGLRPEMDNTIIVQLGDAAKYAV